MKVYRQFVKTNRGPNKFGVKKDGKVASRRYVRRKAKGVLR